MSAFNLVGLVNSFVPVPVNYNEDNRVLNSIDNILGNFKSSRRQTTRSLKEAEFFAHTRLSDATKLRVKRYLNSLHSTTMLDKTVIFLLELHMQRVRGSDSGVGDSDFASTLIESSKTGGSAGFFSTSSTSLKGISLWDSKMISSNHATSNGSTLGHTESNMSGGKRSTVDRITPNVLFRDPLRMQDADCIGELLNICQGMESSLVVFDHHTQSFLSSPKLPLSARQREIIRSIGYFGLLLKRIYDTFPTDARQPGHRRECIMITLRFAVMDQLQAYLELLSSVHSYHKEAGNSFTLLQLFRVLDPMRNRLVMLAALADCCRECRGSQLLDTLYKFFNTGNSQLRGMFREMLDLVTSKFFHMLSQWIYDGALEDPQNELFIALNPMASPQRLWYDKYQLRRAMLPSFLEDSQAKKILITGKSINFLRELCQDSDQLFSVKREAIKPGLLYGQAEDDARTFDSLITHCYVETSRYLLKVLLRDHRLREHLLALRRYFLLGHGDFISSLVHRLGPALMEPSDMLSTHQLNSLLRLTLQDCSPGCNAQLLACLRVELLNFSAEEIGWDALTLLYVIEGPLATVFTEDCMTLYKRGFNFLFRIKRMECILKYRLWTEFKQLSQLGQHLYIELDPVLHLFNVFRFECQHFIQTLQYYLNIQVLECNWQAMNEKIGSAVDLDEVIDIHRQFLDGVIYACMLDKCSRQVATNLRALFDVILDFEQVHGEFAQAAHLEYQRRLVAAKSDSASTSERAKRKDVIDRIRNEFVAKVSLLRVSFKSSLAKFLVDLMAQEDQFWKTLSDFFNFNDFYQCEIEGSFTHQLATQTSQHSLCLNNNNNNTLSR